MEPARFLQEADVKLQKEDYEWAIGRWVMCGKWRAACCVALSSLCVKCVAM